jgi:flagellin-like hook-associated protein FlgL
MGLRINQNIAAMNSYRNLSNTDNQLSKSLEKLSSGFRINRAADDAAGLAISEGLRSQVGGLKVAVRNSQDGISVVQTAEGALNETHSILQRMRDLSVQASNDGGLNDDAKGAIQSEMTQLKSELTRIADTTKFNGKSLLDGNYDGKFQVGANAGESINVKIGTDMSTTGLGLDGVDVTLAEGATATTGTITTQASHDGTTAVSGVVTVAAAKNFTLSESFDGLNGTFSYGDKSLDLSTVEFESGSSAAQRLAAVQTAADAAFGTGAVAVAGTTTGLTFTGDAPATNSDADVAAAQVGWTAATGAETAITEIDDAIKAVSTQRADLGALQNRFDHTINNLNVTVENLSASESRIRDADMAQEMMQFTRNQILSQAGTSMLAQANQGSQGVLSLLR